MLSWRAKKQILILLITFSPLAFGALIIFSVYWPVPSCTDNKKNQQELEIDCGGPCVPCELKHPKTITIFWARAMQVRRDSYDVVAEIQNTNEVLSSKTLDYEFVLFDSVGTAARKKGRTFLYAQERTYIIETGLTSPRIPTRVEFTILGVDWEYRREPKPNIIVERKDYSLSIVDGKFKAGLVEASLFNTTPFNFKDVEINFAVFDKDKNVLGANKIILDEFSAGSHRIVRSLWPRDLGDKVSLVDVEPRVNLK